MTGTLFADVLLNAVVFQIYPGAEGLRRRLRRSFCRVCSRTVDSLLRYRMEHSADFGDPAEGRCSSVLVPGTFRRQTVSGRPQCSFPLFVLDSLFIGLFGK